MSRDFQIKVVNNQKVQIPNIFTSFSSNLFLTIFLMKSKLSTGKKSKTAAFSQVFDPKQFDNNFSREIAKLNFWTKTEDV